MPHLQQNGHQYLLLPNLTKIDRKSLSTRFLECKNSYEYFLPLKVKTTPKHYERKVVISVILRNLVCKIHAKHVTNTVKLVV